MGLRLVVGLGNPGVRYARTRHNVGFRLADFLGGPDWKDFGEGLISKADDVWIAKPTTYMNESGRFVQKVASFYDIAPESVLVCYDEVALPLGRIRIRKEGSAGGQKGMESVIGCLGTDRVPRLRIGVGPQTLGVDSGAFVLARFSKDEESRLPQIIETAADAVREIALRGLDSAMNRYNAG